MEEGEFNEGNLDNTFGRRIYMNGTTKVGWFRTDGDTLHGYGKDGKDEGCFEAGKYKKIKKDIV